MIILQKWYTMISVYNILKIQIQYWLYLITVSIVVYVHYLVICKLLSKIFLSCGFFETHIMSQASFYNFFAVYNVTFDLSPYIILEVLVMAL